MIQIIGGGMYANKSIDFQDFLIIPVGAGCFSEALEIVANVYHATKRIFISSGKPISVADEGGLWPTFSSNREGLDLLMEGIQKAQYTPGNEVMIALDIAATHFYTDGMYELALENLIMTREEFTQYLATLVSEYPILSLEDGMAEDDWEGWNLLSKRLKLKVQLLGDDLFTTNIDRIRKGVEMGIGNSVLIKMNQIGTITETLEAVKATQDAGYLPVISARSGETEDTTIVHLAVASGAGQLKVGSITRSERTAKWNEVLRVEENLGDYAIFAGKKIFKIILPAV